MRKSYKSVLVLVTIALSFIAMPGVLALSQPIGTSQQAMPFESQPTAAEAGSRTVTNPVGNVWDGDPVTTFVSTTYGLATDYWGATSFTRPSDFAKTDFTIASVTMHIQYAAPTLAVDDTYRLVYYVGANGPFVLQDWIGAGAASQTNFAVSLPATTASGGTQLSRSWGEIGDLGDGTWTWDEIASVRVRAEFTLVSTTDARPFRIYEIWLTAYDEAPPITGQTVSVQPSISATMPLEDGSGIGVFFIDIYAHDMVLDTYGLQAFEFSMSWDPAIIQVWDPEFLGSGTWGTFWPWNNEFWWTLDNVAGTLSFSLGIPIANVLVDYGLQGSFPIARIWFAVFDTTGEGGTTIHFVVSTIVAPGGIYITHTSYDGIYGAVVPEFPLGIGIMTVAAPLVLLGYLWRTRKKATRK